MQDKQGKEIVDSQGNTYKSTRDSKVKRTKILAAQTISSCHMIWLKTQD